MKPETEKALEEFAAKLLDGCAAGERARAALLDDPAPVDGTVDPVLVARLAVAGLKGAGIASLASATAAVLATAGRDLGGGWAEALADALETEREAAPPCTCPACVERRQEAEDVDRQVDSVVEKAR